MNETLWIAIAIVAVLTLIVILFVRQGKKQAAERKNKLIEALQHTVEVQGLNIEYQDVLHNRIIALDLKQRVIAFVDWKNEIPHTEVLKLQEFSKCNLLSMGNKITEKRKSGKEVSQVYVTELQLECVSKNDTKYLVMYNEMIDGVLEKQILTEVANKWQQRISGLVG